MAIDQATHDGVLVVTLDAPGVRNALDAGDMAALREIFEKGLNRGDVGSA